MVAFNNDTMDNLRYPPPLRRLAALSSVLVTLCVMLLFSRSGFLLGALLPPGRPQPLAKGLPKSVLF